MQQYSKPRTGPTLAVVLGVERQKYARRAAASEFAFGAIVIAEQVGERLFRFFVDQR